MVSLACNLDDILFPKTFYVTKTADTADGECSADDCSLREAVIASNEAAGHNTIIIPAGTYLLTLTGAHFTDDGPDTLGEIGDLDLSDGVDIHGAGWSTVIQGGATGDLSFRIFEVYEGMSVEIRDLGIRDAYSEMGPGGGGIYNQGELTVDHVFFADNGAHFGGAIYNHFTGTLTVTGSDFSFNLASQGGAIYNKGSLVVQNSTFFSNQADRGGALYNENPGGGGNTITLSDVTISGNEAQYGGGIHNGGGGPTGGTLTVNGMILSYNSACNGGGLYNLFATANLTDALIDHNDVTGSTDTGCGAGGGITNVGTLTLERSAVTQNTAYYAAGINSSVSLTLVNVTLSSNSSTDLSSTTTNWGALVISGAADITNTTIAGNSGSDGTGIHNFGGATINIRNSILANPGADCGGSAINSLGHNLDHENTCGFSSPGDLINTDPLLGPLSGAGTTFLHPLLAGSPAIDAADPAACPATDQRSAARPFGPACDIGAYEFGATAPLPRLVLTLTGSPSEPPSPTQILPASPTPTVSPTLQVFVEPTATRTSRPTDTPPEVIITDTATSTQQIIIFTKPPKSTSTPTPQVIITNTATATPTQPIIIVTFVKPPKITDTPIP